LFVSSDTQQSSSARRGLFSCFPQSDISDGSESQRDKMEIFLSYSSKDRTKAEEIALALQAQGHGVFFDKDDLSGGEDFHAVIREHIANADLFIFKISGLLPLLRGTWEFRPLATAN
jgi:hypothetical protein